MNSEDLSKMGFSEWRVFNRQTKQELLRAAPKSVGVYAIRRDTSFLRARGASDILYIGSAANQMGLYARIGQYLSPGPTQWTNKRIMALLAGTTIYEISWLVTDTIAKSKALEQELLELYLHEHGGLPPENMRR